MLLTEELKKQNAEDKLSKYEKIPAYRQQFKVMENSLLNKVRGLSTQDFVALGDQFQSFQNYHRFLKESTGISNDLGTLPNIALDIITAVHAQSIIPLIASVQTIDEQVGTVYFKNIISTKTRGNVTADNILSSPKVAPDTYPVGYAGEEYTEVLGATVSGTLNYTLAVSVTPVRPRTVVITVPTLNLEGTDNGNGEIFGRGFSGTINYTTGAIQLDLTADPLGVHNIVILTATNFEALDQSTNLPRINLVLDSAQIKAQIFVLASEIGMFKAYELQKRFGKSADSEMVNDLTEAITAEVSNTIIQRLEANVPASPLTWDKTPPDGVSYNDHRFEFLQILNDAEARIYDQTNRGVINVILAGVQASSILAGMPKFKKSNLDGIGAHFYGTLNDNITVIRCPQLSDSYKMIPLYKGSGYFDAPMVYAPYMPLFVTGTIPSPDNILRKEGLAAVWSGVKSVVPNFTTSIQITVT